MYYFYYLFCIQIGRLFFSFRKKKKNKNRKELRPKNREILAEPRQIILALKMVIAISDAEPEII